MEDEFRLLTLQVIGEAILSLEPEECDRVRTEGEARERAVDSICTRYLEAFT